MKKIVFLSVCIFSFLFSFAQEKNEKDIDLPTPPKKRAVVGSKANVNMYHNPHDLDKMKKSSLKSLYIRRTLAIYEVLPFLPLNGHQGATVADLGIPPSKENIKKLEKDLKAKTKYINSLQKHLDEYIGYAEREYLIEGIMFMEEVLGHIHNMNHDVGLQLEE